MFFPNIPGEVLIQYINSLNKKDERERKLIDLLKEYEECENVSSLDVIEKIFTVNSMDNSMDDSEKTVKL
jgi:hypothetical protein